MLRINNN